MLGTVLDPLVYGGEGGGAASKGEVVGDVGEGCHSARGRAGAVSCRAGVHAECRQTELCGVRL